VKDYVIALDLGQAQDYSAAVVLKRCWWRKGERTDPERARLWHEIPTILRWPLGTPYPKIIQEVSETFALFETNYAQMGVVLVVDAGGPGRPVIDTFKAKPYRLRPVGVTITSGDLPHDRPDGSLTVPKRDICSALVVAYQSGDVKMNPKVEHAAEFKDEISKFGYVVKPASRKLGYEGLEPEVHDDIVVAAAMGLWYSTTKLARTYFDPKHGADVQPMHNPMAKGA